uniref:Uncharacterized protein LOC104244944 n=1 Tax=Nicotiana sylvestris TaxID=4096 RepID=A0A1U7Y6L9_NICSY|nr:PREDICTED: uncharacterized protein LOC104244944 [Nicotiana sylvestris]
MNDLVGSHTASIQKLEMQMRDPSREQNPKQMGTLHSDTIANQKGSGSGRTCHVMVITNRSGKVLQGEGEQVVEKEEFEKEVGVEEPSVVEIEKISENAQVQEENRETVKEKKEDPGAFTIPCTIGVHDFARTLCDNGASINFMPLSIYKKVGLCMPRPTSMILQMVDRSIKRPVGIVDDVLVKVGKFHLHADFVILDCAVDKDIPIILGRPLLVTGRALMDSERNEIKFCVNDEEVTFQESKGIKLPHEYESILVIDVVDEVDDAVEMKMEEQFLGEALVAILVNFDGEDMEGYMESVNALEGLGSYTYVPEKLSLDLENRATPPAKPSIIELPQLELKPLAPHLRLEEAERPKGDLEINDAFPDKHILAISRTFAPWYANVANYLVSDLIPDGLESYQKKKFLRDCRQYYWEQPFLFRVCAHNIIIRCVPDEEIMPILKACHDSPVGGHPGGNRTATKVLECGYYWTSIYHDAIKWSRLVTNVNDKVQSPRGMKFQCTL